MKWPQGLRWEQEETNVSGRLCDQVRMEVSAQFLLLFLLSSCVSSLQPPDLYKQDPQKRVGSLVNRHTSIQLVHPFGQTSREVLQRVRSIRPKLTDWNIVIIISLSYITSFLQHKNRSITMITIFLNVNIQYLLHFQINLFLIYSVVIILPTLKKTQNKVKSTGTDESDNRCV